MLVPPGYDGQTPHPLIVFLHGYADSGSASARAFGLPQLAAERGFLLVAPDGTPDETNLRFWNATDGCCNLFASTVDDRAYLVALLNDTQRRYAVDPRRVYLVGHSNGGFMAYRMACEESARLAAIVSIAGATWLDAARCQPESRVSVLQIHGDQDGIIKYEGGRFAAQLELYPSAQQTVAACARHNRCADSLSALGPPLDLDVSVPGSETQKQQHAGCADSAVELWTIAGGEHFPALGATFRQQLASFLLSHPKASDPVGPSVKRGRAHE